MAKLRLMSSRGDVCLAEWQSFHPETIREAAGAFQRHRADGCLAFRVDAPGQTHPIDEFDAEAHEILLVPPVRGG